MSQQSEKYLTAQEAADRLRLSLFQTRVWLKRGKLQGSKVGRDWRIPESAVEAALRGS